LPQQHLEADFKAFQSFYGESLDPPTSAAELQNYKTVFKSLLRGSKSVKNMPITFFSKFTSVFYQPMYFSTISKEPGT
jgi:hypothetical protein